MQMPLWDHEGIFLRTCVSTSFFCVWKQKESSQLFRTLCSPRGLQKRRKHRFSHWLEEKNMSQHLDVSSVSLKPRWDSVEIASPSRRISKRSGNFLTGALMNRSEPLEKKEKEGFTHHHSSPMCKSQTEISSVWASPVCAHDISLEGAEVEDQWHACLSDLSYPRSV